jgi:hypothetical protein
MKRGYPKTGECKDDFVNLRKQGQYTFMGLNHLTEKSILTEDDDVQITEMTDYKKVKFGKRES